MKTEKLRIRVPAITHLPCPDGPQMPLQPIMMFKDEPSFLSPRYCTWLSSLPPAERERKLKWQAARKRQWMIR